MQKLTRYYSTVALGAALALAGACSKNQDTASTDSASADSAAAATNTAATPADSTAMAAPGAPGAPGAMTAPNALAMIGLSNAAEIGTSQVAQEKATRADVRDFAKMMVTDHQAMQKEADELATKANLTPTPPPQADQKRAAGDQMVQQLNSTAKGAEFDKAYVDGQVQAHQQTLTELQSMQSTVDNADVRALIEKAIPKVQDHLARAQKLQSGAH
jgi:putative membrane protein